MKLWVYSRFLQKTDFIRNTTESFCRNTFSTNLLSKDIKTIHTRTAAISRIKSRKQETQVSGAKWILQVIYFNSILLLVVLAHHREQTWPG